jgi:EAL domain-containing protein (putative c-di-GMP-specific phosphodiesterase class I)
MLDSPDPTNDSLVPLTLYVSAINGAEDVLLRRTLVSGGFPIGEPFPHVLSIPCDLDVLRQITNICCSHLSPAEQERIACHVSSGETLPSMAELMRARSLRILSDWVESQWIGRVLAGRRLTTYFQPIVSNVDPRNVFGYECLMRGFEENGDIIHPLRLIEAAKKAGVLPELDQMARLVAIQNAAERCLAGVVFINFSPHCLARNRIAVDSTIDAAIMSCMEPWRFVFEVVESEQIDDLQMMLEILNSLREAGFRVALDDVGAGYNSLTRLADIKPDFVKVDMDLMRNVDRDRFKSCVARKLIELSRELGVKTIAEGIESNEEWMWAREHGADFSQGYLFARPAPDPPRPNFPAGQAALIAASFSTEIMPCDHPIDTPTPSPGT